MNTPVPHNIVQKVITQNKAQNLDTASIRRVVAVAGQIEASSGVEFIRMEIGSPGFASPKIGIEAEKEALDKGVTATYPIIDGLPLLKEQASRFIKSFVGINIPPRSCIPTVGSMQGVMASFVTTMLRDTTKDTVLFLDPGFAVQKQQLQVLGYKYLSYDIYEHRGAKLESSLRNIVNSNHISSVVYSNPNNPTWMCLTECELEVIGRLADEYDFVVIEDMAYMCMDFRNDLSQPDSEPYQVTVARYTKNYIIHISASKIFSYAGQRISIAAISDTLFDREFPALRTRFTHSQFGTTFVYSVLYALSSGVTHTVQHALAAMFRAASDGKLDFVDQMREYGKRAARLKEVFERHGFIITYDMDGDKPIADGFFFTISYPAMTGAELLNELLHYGVSAITLKATGAEREGLRACTSAIKPHHMELLEERLAKFVENHSQTA